MKSNLEIFVFPEMSLLLIFYARQGEGEILPFLMNTLYNKEMSLSTTDNFIFDKKNSTSIKDIC